MFEHQRVPRVFALPPGVDFPAALVDGLRARMADHPPEAMARVTLLVNTRRMARRIRALFDAGPACFLPRISLVTDLEPPPDAPLAPAVPPLRRRLQLAQLVARLLDGAPDLAPRATVYDLADSLAELMDEMQGEGVDPQTVLDLDVSDQSGHWARAQAFIGITRSFFDETGDGMDAQARLRRVTQSLIADWADNPPGHPVILAGSTGSRGSTALLMGAVANLPQGAVILPGFDDTLPAPIWDRMTDALTSEDHPQFRFAKLLRDLGTAPDAVRPWHDTPAPVPARNRAISLALRPAPVTDAWLAEGPDLPDLAAAFADVTLVEAQTPRQEALAIALRLRQAAEEGVTAALITPDRMLTRQVTATLGRWGILPDDSAGLPLHLSPPGRFLRHVAGLFRNRLTIETLLTLLKHPLTHDGAARREHLLVTRDLELHLRRKGPAFPDGETLRAWAEARDGALPGWPAWIAGLKGMAMPGKRPLADWVADLRGLAERLSAGSAADGSGTLWDMKAGQAARAVIEDLEAEAVFGGDMSAHEFADLLDALLSRGEVRDRDAPHPGIMIWGTLEARVQGAELLILGGLNEGVWPEAARPDPWLNRTLRDKAGLLLPDRRIGLSAHDFQQAAAAGQVWLTRAVRSEDAETVASRWLNRLTNLLGGLPGNNGPQAIAEMRARGSAPLDWARQLEQADAVPPAPRPSPRPPEAARPRELSVTEIKRLIRDPYSVYAKRVLRLKPLDPMQPRADALQRGIVLHRVFEEFVKAVSAGTEPLDRERLMAFARRILAEEIPWPTARILWLARLSRIADWFIAREAERQAIACPAGFETRAKAEFADIGFSLIGTADRIDRDAGGGLFIYDYKSGTPPTKTQQQKFDKQLLIEAAMAERGAFNDIGPGPVRGAVFIGLGSGTEMPAPLEAETPAQTWDDLRALLAATLAPAHGYTARRMMEQDRFGSDYDHLSRYGEWDETDVPAPEDLT